MKHYFFLRFSLVVVFTILVLYSINLLLLNPLPSYGQQRVQYKVVDQIQQNKHWDRMSSPTQNLERILNFYGNKGWKLVYWVRPENNLIFAKF